MSVNYAQHFQTRQTPQSEPIPGSTQVKNSAGGFAFEVDDWARLDRFLILGSEGGSYYAAEKQLTIENAQVVMRCLDADGPRTVRRIVEISQAGRAPKNDPALFALAMAAGASDVLTKNMALQSLSKVARIGTHLFTFLENVQGFRGWGRALRRAVGDWYNDQDAENLAYQLLKYRQRNGWSHRDALRLASPTPISPVHNALYRWVVSPDSMGVRQVPRQAKKDGPVVTTEYPAVNQALLPELVMAFQAIQGASTSSEVVEQVKQHPRVSWEMIPTQFLGDPKVWEVLLPNLPQTALLRNLARMTANGLISPMSSALELVVRHLTDTERILKARVHPIAILGALLTYRQGQGHRGDLRWSPVAQVVDALDNAFYKSLDTVEPSGKRLYLALDVSGSMGSPDISGMPGLNPRIASAALAMVTARVETMYHIAAFSAHMVPVSISQRERLDDVIQNTSRIPFGPTNCAVPMLDAANRSIPVDTFVIYTDSETWCGEIHPVQALQQYRQVMGIPAKLVVVGMVSNGFSIADPDDAGMLDVVGFDTSTPDLISEFSKS